MLLMNGIFDFQADNTRGILMHQEDQSAHGCCAKQDNVHDKHLSCVEL
jgi:hypothetical protein